jgi:hypothetical protein
VGRRVCLLDHVGTLMRLVPESDRQSLVAVRTVSILRR